MAKQYIAVVRNEESEYPKDKNFRPHIAYPEYVFRNDISSKKNYVYEMIRESFHLLHLDYENYNTKQWNPLGVYIKPGDSVILKPNLVLDKNYNLGEGVECIYTHPSVVAAVIDYVVIALKGKGQIVVADAPVQQCRFEKLIAESGYGDLIQWYKDKNINIRIVDLRSSNNQVDCEGWIQYPQNICKKENGILVSLDDKSAFCGLSDEKLQRLRVMNFDPRIMHKHHQGNKHEYMIAREILAADVIINLPKPKTHRIAGITGAQKNLIGACANKEYLPHYTQGGGIDVKGDSYIKSNFWLDVSDKIMDIKNIFNREGHLESARKAAELYDVLVREGQAKEDHAQYTFGCWYGNDTIWRTIADLNKIVIYADKNGVVNETPQRKMFILGDMIVSGEKEGPVSASAHRAGIVVAGEHPLCFDRVVCALMGFDEKSIPQLDNKKMRSSSRLDVSKTEPIVISNDLQWDKSGLSNIRDNSLKFIPSDGWEYAIGNPKKNNLLKEKLISGKHIIIFGAGVNGVRAHQYINKWCKDIVVDKFWDNNHNKQGKKIAGDIYCTNPGTADDEVCLIAAGNHFLASIYIEVRSRGFKDEDIIIFSPGFVGNGIEYRNKVSCQ